jgi:aspartate aminotransferase
MSISRWSRAQLQDGGWIRRMFMEGERLRAEFGESTVADLSIGQPLEAPETIVEAFAAASREKFRGRFGYMPNLGYPDVRDRAAEDVDFPGITSDSIAMTAGAACAINAAIRTFVDPGDDVIGVAPYFPEFRLYCETASARFVPVPTGPDLRLDLDGISGALSAHTAAVIVNSPCNPSGHVLDGGELSGLASVLEAHNNRHDRKVLLIIDEVYRRLTYPPHQRVEPFNVYEHTVLARSFSKDLGVAGERIGYLVLHPSLATPETHRGLAQALRALGFVNAPATAQRALLHLDSWEINADPYRERRDIVMDRVRADGLEAMQPEGGLYLWLRSPWPDTLQLIDALAARRVLLTPGIAFGVPSHLRLCFSAPRPKLTMAMDALAELATEPLSA